MSETSELVLIHYGVKGMKWGVVKADEPGETKPKKRKSLTPEQRKKLVKVGITVAVGAAVVTAVIVTHGKIKVNRETENLVQEAIARGKILARNRDFSDVVVPKEVQFHRIAKTLETEITDPKYATFIERDVMNYRATWEGNFKIKYDAISDVKIASVKSQLSQLSNIMDEPLSSATKKGLTVRKLLESETDNRYARKAIRKADPKLLADIAVGQRAGGAWNDDVSKALIRKLKTSGYSALTDGADTRVLAEHAVVLFDNEFFKTTGARLTRKERDEAYSAVKTELRAQEIKKNFKKFGL